MQYIKKVNKIEAIQNKGSILTDVIPFLNEHGIPYEYTESLLRGSQIGVITNRDNFEQEEYSQLYVGDYLVINKGVISIMNAKEFESKYQEDDSVGRKNINTELSTNITLDTTRAQRAFDLLGETVKQIKNDEHVTKQPHIRIEFDDIRDVPKVWVDGELIGDLRSNRPLVSLNIDWNTDTEIENHKEFDINYQDFTGERPMSRGFREGSLM
ncbi:hypothetical protein [Leuconostoc mesenteroides]|uniref:hypothetical protein n=1 Tax=Leuconostoc mesenteroides TaxID=1245 RepID=UPI0006814C5B|nr:hypothetical protein [Leuconostoc mesenteroides]KMY77169.1 hypothetical protein WZ79_08930 [Leuconostoc mesenteroides subsp. mesenteroides]